MKLSDTLRARRATISDEMRSLVDAAAAESRDLSAEQRTKFDGLKAEKDRLTTSIADAEATEDADRKDEGRDLGGDLAEGEVRALLPEQRMSALVKHEGPPLSLRALLRAQVFGDWSGAENERRAMGEGVGALGGWMVPPSLSATIIDLARSKTALIPSGVLTIPMPGPEMTFVKVRSDPTPVVRREHQPITESSPTLEPYRAKAHVVAAMVRTSVELQEDAPQAGQVIENTIAAALALKADQLGCFGAGTNEPLGLFNVDGINVVSLGANGAVPADFDPFLDAIAAVETANGVPTAAIFSPRTKRTLAGLKTGIASDKTPLTPPADYTALRRTVSNQIPNNLAQGSANNTSAAFVGDFSQAAFAIRTSIMMEATRVGGTDTFAKLEILVRAYMRMDFVVLRPSHFAKIVGIKA